MAVETELKLRITPEHMKRLRRHPAFKSLLGSRATTRKLHSEYFDTPQLALHARGMALRLRHSGRQWMQALKGSGSVKGGLHQRDEWEMPVMGATLDLAQLKASGAPALPGKIRNSLQPVFSTDFTRSSYLLDYESAQVELCMDSGKVTAGDKKQPISELELELKSGDPRLLYKLALALLDIVPLEVEYSNKAEYGYRLCVQQPPEIAKASLPALTRNMSTADALQSMLWLVLQHLQANLPGALHTEDEEYLHQVRVALRRLRVLLGVVKSMHAEDAELLALRQEIAALFAELGQAREWDVFLTQTLAEIRAHFPDDPSLATAIMRAEQLRQQQRARALAALQAQSLQRLLLRLAMWMHAARWQQVEAAGGVTQSAGAILRRRQRQVMRCGAVLLHTQPLEIAPMELHALRLASKKLRYSTEIFTSLYGGKENKAYLSALSRLQEILGLLNDIAVARRMLHALDAEQPLSCSSLIRGWMEREYALQIIRLRRAWVRFSRQKPSWAKQKKHSA